MIKDRKDPIIKKNWRTQEEIVKYLILNQKIKMNSNLLKRSCSPTFWSQPDVSHNVDPDISNPYSQQAGWTTQRPSG
jgi:hypothetical protein